MKISDLKQPYRRMAEYYRMVERSELTGRIEIYIPNQFPEPEFNHWFWTEIKNGNHPPITEEIKKHFPPDFDFSGEEVKIFTKRRKLKKNNYPTKLNIEDIKKIIENYKKGLTQVQSSKLLNINNAYLGKILHCYLGNEKAKQKIGIAVNALITKIKEEENLFEKQTLQIPNNPIIQKRIYTQLAKEGKFDHLPDTCEFSEAVELEVWDDELQKKRNRLILGKFKGVYLEEDLTAWNFAKLLQKIDFSEFKTGDVVEVETTTIGYVYGYIREVESDKLLLSFGYMSDVLRTITREKTKSITKIK